MSCSAKSPVLRSDDDRRETDRHGFLDAASAALLVFPGRYSTVNFHCNVRCLKQACISYGIESLIAEYFHQGFVIGDNEQLITPLGEISGLFETPGNC